LPGGGRAPESGNFFDIGNRGNWWPIDETGSDAYRRGMNNYRGYVDEACNTKDYGYSVRCVLD